MIQEYIYDIIFGDNCRNAEGQRQTLLLGAQMKTTIHRNFVYFTTTFIYKANLVSQPFSLLSSLTFTLS